MYSVTKSPNLTFSTERGSTYRPLAIDLGRVAHLRPRRVHGVAEARLADVDDVERDRLRGDCAATVAADVAASERAMNPDFQDAMRPPQRSDAS